MRAYVPKDDKSTKLLLGEKAQKRVLQQGAPLYIRQAKEGL